jgi:hypothetical protein
VNPRPIEAPAEPSTGGFHAKFRSLLFIVFAGEIGCFLLFFPWMPIWHHTSITSYLPWLTGMWDSPYFRGAISGLGAVNLYISFLEILHLRARSLDRHPAGPPEQRC